jgi:hypothetical protein
MYELMGRAHAALLRAERGQGTVEYVGLILLIAVVITAVVAAGAKAGDSNIASTIIAKLKGAIDGVSSPSKP